MAGAAAAGAGAANARARRRVTGYLEGRGAVSAAYTPAKTDIRAFERLRRAGVLVEAAPGRFFLDLVRYHEVEAVRQRRTWQIALGVALTLAALALLFYSSGTLTPQPISRP